MKAMFLNNGTLEISGETTVEELALRWWVEANKVTNINGVDLIPTRHLVIRYGGLPIVSPSTTGSSRTTREGKG